MAASSPLKVFRARRIRTMDPSLPEGTAVAVRDGLIVEVGTLKTLKPWLDAHPHEIDDRFAEHVLLPGFIDPHLHPTMAAVLLPMSFITAMEWRLPWGTVSPVRGKDAFLDRIKELDTDLDDPDEPLFTWGYHQLWHGAIRRPDLDALGIQRPLVVWHRSFHEIIVNSSTLRWMELDDGDTSSRDQVDLANGHFYEMGLKTAVNRLMPYLLAPKRYADGLTRLAQVAHFGGHTTIGDMAAGLFNLDMEWDATTRLLDTEDTPFRVHLVPDGNLISVEQGSPEAGLELIRTLPDRSTHRLQFRDHVKLFTDGAFFSLLMQVGEPGYIDGHDGEWITVPERFEKLARMFWKDGYRIHVHCTGDLGLELALDTLDKLQWERPRFDHRFTIEHFGLATQEQTRRIADLGAQVSANAYYLYELSDIYARKGLGHERASQISRLGSLARNGVRIGLHSDFTMAPALPLHSAWIAANRLNAEGEEMGPTEKLTLDQALRAITIDAAYMLGMENEIGSIRAGKKADFVVLEQDPYEVPVAELRDIPIWGTVFEGRPFPIER